MAQLDGLRTLAEGGRAHRAVARLTLLPGRVLALAGLAGSFLLFTEAHWAHVAIAFGLAALLVSVVPRPYVMEVRQDADATGRVRRMMEARAAAFVAALPDPCVVVDGRGVVMLGNERAREALPGMRIGDPLSFVLRVPEVTEAVAAAMAGGGPTAVLYQEKVPIERWFEAYVAPVRVDPSVKAPPDYVAITLHDQTNQRRLERMRVDFVANASHELRTPLASLSGFIETLQGPARNDAVARERFLEIMRGQAVRMSRLIEDLLSLSRIELNAHVRPETVVDVRAIVAQTLDALGPLAREQKVSVQFLAPDGPLATRGDRDELYRVFENLIENALKYGAAGQSVTVEIERKAEEAGAGASWAVRVRDRGPGIAEEHIPRLTERFYRVDTAWSREKGGTGLGLAIVKHILARHRGRLSIESTLGEGSVFTVYLEADDMAKAEHAQATVV